jgi:hypothetical protein
MRYLKIIFFFLLFLGIRNSALAQDSSIHIYLGANGNFLGISDAGWGVEAGIRYNDIYFGAEYGNYGDGRFKQSDYPDGSIDLTYWDDPHLPTTREHYVGIHGGIVINDIFWLGYTLLLSEQKSIHPEWQYYVGGFKWFPVTSFWLDVGPDVRIEGWQHLMLNIAYSHRRGFKSGLGYIF